MLVLLFVALWFICGFSVLLALRLPRLGKRELILVFFICFIDLCLFGFVGFLFLLMSGKAAVCDCGTPWTFLLPFFYSTRRFALCLTLCHFDLVFFIPFSIAITLLGEEGANLSAFCTFVRFVLIWICRFPLPPGVWEGLRFVIMALPGLFSYLFLEGSRHLV